MPGSLPRVQLTLIYVHPPPLLFLIPATIAAHQCATALYKLPPFARQWA
jgi:hypothetical protein